MNPTRARHDARQKGVCSALPVGICLAVPCHLGAFRGLEYHVGIGVAQLPIMAHVPEVVVSELVVAGNLKGGCGPRAVAVMLVDVICSCRVSGRILCALDEVELLDKQAARAAKGNKMGCCPRVRAVELFGMAEPSVGRIELGKPSDETRRRVVEGRDT